MLNARQFSAIVCLINLWVILWLHCGPIFRSLFQFQSSIEAFGWENKSRNASDYFQQDRYTMSIPGWKLCGKAGQVVIVVTTEPSNFAQRKLIRETWASAKPDDVTVGFLVGVTSNRSVRQSLQDESYSFEDIIQDNFVDSYQNLSLKSIALLRWFVYQCPKTRFLMKVDADTFVNIGKVIETLQDIPRRRVLRGQLMNNVKVIRDTGNKLYTPEYMYWGDMYPQYLAGPGYLMSRDVAITLHRTVFRVPIFHLEDVYVTGMCANAAGVRILPLVPGMRLVDGDVVKKCSEALACHSVPPELMGILWKRLLKP